MSEKVQQTQMADDKAIEKSICSLICKQESKSKVLSQEIDSLILNIQSCKQVLQANIDASAKCDDKSVDAINKLQTETINSKVVKKIKAEHKQIHSMISKLGKSIDKAYFVDYASVDCLPVRENCAVTESEDSKEKVGTSEGTGALLQVNIAVACYLFHTGNFDVGDAFIKEAELQKFVPDKVRSHYVAMNKILASLKQFQLDPLFDWCKENETLLKEFDNNLLFYVHKARFLQILHNKTDDSSDNVLSAIQYARQHIDSFMADNASEIKNLMGNLIFKQDQLNHLKADSIWKDVADTFQKCFCKITKLPRYSPLLLSVQAGELIIPRLIKYYEVFKTAKTDVAASNAANASTTNTKWLNLDELPVESSSIHRFHSVFTCPISKEQTSYSNPPIFLTCGHIISYKSLLNIVKPSGKFKCPTCPSESRVSQTKKVIF